MAIGCVLLGAGQSKRMGCAKQLLTYQGHTLLEIALSKYGKIHPHIEEREHILLVYDVPISFQIHLSLSISRFHCLLFSFRLFVGIWPFTSA